MEPLISVIIPIYKVEKYIEHCLRSVMGQTYSRLEIIAVDDGSPDRSGEICDRLALEDDRLRVFHNENQGVSAARNLGLDQASGEYVAFIDSDDYVAENYIAYLVGLAEGYDADIACCDIEKVNEQSELPCASGEYSFCCSGYEACALLLTKMRMQLTVVTGKIVKADLARRFGFPDGKIFEDALTSYKYYYYCDRVAVGDAKLYAYYQNDSGIMAENSLSSIDDRAAAHIERAVFFEEKNERELAKLAWNNTINMLYTNSVLFDGIADSEIRTTLKRCRNKDYFSIFTLAKCCAVLRFPKTLKRVRTLLGK